MSQLKINCTRPKGFSAMVRLKNEAHWLEASLKSIATVYDEIACFVQPSTDQTLEILQDLKSSIPTIKIHEYLVDSLPNGPGYARQNPNAENSRTYFYNWCLARTTFAWATKWDGDMVALPNYGDFRDHSESKLLVFEKGYEVVDITTGCLAPWLFTASEPRHFKVVPGRKYRNGPECEVLETKRVADRIQGKRKISKLLDLPTYVHLKFCKNQSELSSQITTDWEEDRISNARQQFSANEQPVHLVNIAKLI